MELLQRLRNEYLAVANNAHQHHAKVWDYCPHCEEKTPWMARVLNGYFRCLQCGKNPLHHPAAHEADDASPDADAVA
ncbi:hypothetical protein [Salisaeta longa]|uniref:hypothetical protein n=1 Tax=Salisaeta longa TaxID=503170 RepID=UPI0003B416B1|nr:hypothetical protein [Salisaeta longa]